MKAIIDDHDYPTLGSDFTIPDIGFIPTASEVIEIHKDLFPKHYTTHIEYIHDPMVVGKSGCVECLVTSVRKCITKEGLYLVIKLSPRAESDNPKH